MVQKNSNTHVHIVLNLLHAERKRLKDEVYLLLQDVEKKNMEIKTLTTTFQQVEKLLQEEPQGLDPVTKDDYPAAEQEEKGWNWINP